MTTVVRRSWAGGLGVAALFFGASALGGSKVAVLPLRPINVDAQVTAILDERLLTIVQQDGHFEQVVGASDIGAMLGLEKLKDVAGCGDTTCMADIGGALGVDYLLSGTVGQMGNRFTAALKLLDMVSSPPQVLSRVDEEVPADTQQYTPALRAAMSRLVGLAVDGTPTGARISVEGKDVGELPYLGLFPPGTYQVRIASPGFTPVERSLKVGASRLAKATVKLTGLPATLDVRTRPTGATVAVNERAVGTSDATLELAAGEYLVTTSRRGYDDATKKVTLAPGESAKIDLELAPGWSSLQRERLPWAIGLTALAVAGVAVFAWKGLEARSIDSELAGAPWSASAASRERTGKNAAHVADAGGAIGVASAIAAGICWWRVAF